MKEIKNQIKDLIKKVESYEEKRIIEIDELERQTLENNRLRGLIKSLMSGEKPFIKASDLPLTTLVRNKNSREVMKVLIIEGEPCFCSLYDNSVYDSIALEMWEIVE